MRVKYLGKTIAKADKRFKQIRWQDGDFKDLRIRKSKSYAKAKRNKRVESFKYELVKTLKLIIMKTIYVTFNLAVFESNFSTLLTSYADNGNVPITPNLSAIFNFKK